MSQPFWVQVFIGLKASFEKAVRVIGPAFVCLAVVLISSAVFVHFVHNIPFYNPYTSLPSIMHLLSSTYIAFSIAYNYIKAVITPPGYTPSFEELRISPEEQQKILHLVDNPLPGRYVPWCKKCARLKPERAHHCHVCGRCVLKMDHHCPWIANCVGHNNHQYFVLFLFWLWLGCLYCGILGFLPFSFASNNQIPFTGVVPRGAVIFAFVIASAVWIAMCIMLGWQLVLIFTAQTTIEFYQNREKARWSEELGKVFTNPYDLGWDLNFQHFFGTMNGEYWFSYLVPGGAKSHGDGIKWTTRYESPV